MAGSQEQGTAKSNGREGDGAVEEGELIVDGAIRFGGSGGSGGAAARGSRRGGICAVAPVALRLLQLQGCLLVCCRAVRQETSFGGSLEGRVGAHTGKVGEGCTSARAHGSREAIKHARVLGRHADGSGHGEGSKNAERTNEHRVCVCVGKDFDS